MHWCELMYARVRGHVYVLTSCTSFFAMTPFESKSKRCARMLTLVGIVLVMIMLTRTVMVA